MTSTVPPGRISSAVSPRRLWAAAFLLFCVALGLRLWGINFGLPALYRPDEDVTVGRAMGILHGSFDPHFADWPHLYFNLSAAWLGIGRLLGIVSDQASGYLGIRILDAVLGSLTVVLLFEFGRRAYGLLAGLLAASALAFAFLHLRDSHFATLDIPLTLATTGGLYVAYRTISERGRRPLLLNGILLGIAASLKYNGALVFSGMAAAQVLRARLQETALIRLLGRLALIGVIGLATLIVTSPFLLLDPAVTQHGVGYIFQHLAKATAPAIGWVELSRALWYGIDPALAVLGVIGIAYAAWRREPADLIVLTFVVAYFLVIGAGRSVFFRYADPLIPPLLLLGGRALAALVGATTGTRQRWLALAGAIAIVAGPSLAHDVQYDLLIQQTDTRTLAYNWLADHVPPGSRAAVPYMAGPAHDQAMIDSGEHSHAATDPYVASFLDSRLETQYSILELAAADLQLTSLDRFKNQGIQYVVVGYETPGTGCRVESPLERLLQQQAQLVASFSATDGCPQSVFDPIDTYYVPLVGYQGWQRPGPSIRIYRLAG
ncbi:MAG TPA: phospholipid carrier-dependent glycosyltransferase [Candidatus Dormibacteraeota bacterium]|nr:phospholipid carrier-dependent glycosyltransferase [Candidatus Dormibacteraeota bacterium]